MFEKFMQRFGLMLAAFAGALVVATAVSAEPWAPLGLSLTGVATTDAGCPDLGGGLNILSNTLLCISPTQLEPLTLSGAGTGLNVTTNALVGGTLGVTGLTTTAAITSSGTHTVSSTTPINFTADTGGTGDTITAAATGTITTSIPELSLLNHNITAGTFGCPDTGTGSTNLMLQIGNAANLAHDFEINCKGNATFSGSSFTALQVNVGTNVSLTSASGGQGEVNTGGAALIAGALGTGSVALGAGGVLGTDVNCGSTPISTVGKAATMTNGLSCLILVVTADIAGPFTINYIHAFNSKPQCQVTMAINTTPVNVKSCLAGLSSALVTLTGSVAANDEFQITLTGGK